jgi:hypothetical protein
VFHRETQNRGDVETTTSFVKKKAMVVYRHPTKSQTQLQSTILRTGMDDSNRGELFIRSYEVVTELILGPPR